MTCDRSSVRKIDRTLNNKFQNHLDFFLGKLSQRGYPLPKLRHLVTLAEKHFAQKKAEANKHTLKFFLKVPFSFSLNQGALKRALHAHVHILEHNFQKRVQFVLAKTTQKNLFRLLSKQNWRRDQGASA